MSISTSMWGILAADPGVQAVFGSPPRIYPETIPQFAPMPAALYFLISGQLAGGFETQWAGENEHIQIDVYAEADRDLAWAGMDAIRTALENTDALIAAGLSARCLGANVTDYDAESHRYRISYDWSFWQSR